MAAEAQPAASNLGRNTPGGPLRVTLSMAEAGKMIANRIYQWARAQPNKIAIIHNDVPLSYATFARAIEVTRGYLAAQELPAGRTAIVLENDLIDSWLAILALRLLGLNTISVISVAQSESLKLRDVACVVTTQADHRRHGLNANSFPDAKIVTVPPSLYANIHAGEVPMAQEGNRPFGGHILYTSGTTGSYKKALQDGANDDKRVAAYTNFLGFDKDTVYHGTNFGLWTAAGFRMPTAVWHVAGCVVTDQRPEFLTNLSRHGTTHAALLPQDFKEFLQLQQASEPRQSGLEIITAGSFLPLATAEKVVSQPMISLTVIYGSTECGPILQSRFKTRDDLFWLAPDSKRTIQIVAESGDECPIGREGELRVLTTDIDSKSYLDDEEASAQVFRDGFFYPGDLATRRADGRIRILGRATDVLNFQGQKIAVAPIEQMIQRRLQVDEVCLFSGLTDEGTDDLVIAVQSDRDLSKPELDAVAREFPSFERVRFAVLREFPRTDTGTRKTRRLALRRLVFGGTQ